MTKRGSKKKRDKREKNLIMILSLSGFVIAMISIAYASVPLYTAFCAATGLGGTTQRASAAPAQTKNRMVTVSFDGNVDKNLPWEFGPEVKDVQMKLGEIKTIKYRAKNNSDKALVGTATFNVQPSKAGSYFNKIQCFCFTKQVIKPGQEVELPVQFFVDPSMADNHNNDDVTNITLSYTFFLAKDQSKATALNRVSAAKGSTAPEKDFSDEY